MQKSLGGGECEGITPQLVQTGEGEIEAGPSALAHGHVRVLPRFDDLREG